LVPEERDQTGRIDRGERRQGIGRSVGPEGEQSQPMEEKGIRGHAASLGDGVREPAGGVRPGGSLVSCRRPFWQAPVSPMAIDLDTVLRVPDSVLFQQVSDESVLLDMDSEQYFGLDEVGTRIWQLIVEDGRLGDVHVAMLDEYDVDPQVLERDLLDLVGTLAQKGLVVVEGAAGESAPPADAL
jgi:hypothetical protein